MNQMSETTELLVEIHTGIQTLNTNVGLLKDAFLELLEVLKRE